LRSPRRRPERRTTAWTRPSRAGHPPGYQDCFNSFVAEVYGVVRGQRPDGMPMFEDGLRAALVTDAVLGSGHDGTWSGVATA
jgi:hypothetical protein